MRLPEAQAGSVGRSAADLSLPLSTSGENTGKLRRLPAVHRLLGEPQIAGFVPSLGATVVKAAIGSVLQAARKIGDGVEMPSPAELIGAVVERLTVVESAELFEVINGTGVLLHTNLGRAPLADDALTGMATIGGGYSNLEFDLETGTRGSRYARVSSLLRQTTGAEDGLVVNNCAAAVLLILDTFARPVATAREVLVARNQLIEIGGGFRLPDVLRRSGATLVEVGATNRVYLADFERALGPNTALLLRSHTSNYRIDGFVADVEPAELAALGRRAGIPTVEDLGSGVLVDLAPYGLPHERTVQQAVADGIDLIAFSGDKLLGGPQAGIIVGRSVLVARLRANPLLRALRVDKTGLAALAATLRLYLDPSRLGQIPLYAMLAYSVAQLRARAERLSAELASVNAALSIVDSEAFVGGGALPLAGIASVALSIRPPAGDPNRLAAALRRARPAVIGRVDGDAVLLDLRTISPAHDPSIVRAVRAAFDR